MSGGEFVYKSVKLSFTKDEARLDGPDGLIAKADLETIKGVLTAAVPAIGMENCVKLGAAATALTVAGLAIPKIWNWATASGVKEGNVLQLAIAKDKEGEFAEKMEDGLLLAEIRSKFKRLDLNRLEGLIGPGVKKQIGEEVVKTLKGIGIESAQAVNETGSTVNIHCVGGDHTLRADDAVFLAKSSAHQSGSVANINMNNCKSWNMTANRAVFMAGNVTSEDQKMAYERVTKDKKEGQKNSF